MKNTLRYTLIGALLISSILAAQSPVIDQDEPTRQVINDDLEVIGSLGIGLDTPANQGYGFDTVIMRENNLRMYFNDTSNSGSFPTNDWRFTFNDSSNGGANYFSLDDVDAGYQAFRVDAGAGSNALRVESGGNVGIGIADPAVKLHVFNTDTPTMRLDQIGGFGSYRWDVAGNETNFFVRDVNSNSLPFRIRPGVATSTVDIGAAGTVAINGTASNANISLDLRANNRAMLPNRMNNADRASLAAALTAAEAGAIVYDTEDLLTYSWDGTQWVAIGVDTDDQTVDTFQLNGNNLELSLEDDGVPVNTVDLSGYLDNTDDQIADTFQLNGNNLELSLENDGVGVNSVDLSGYLDNTDNQDISGSNLAANILTIGITGGASEAVDLSSLDNPGTDDQQLTLAANTLTLEDGGSVDLSGYLDNTDEQFLGYALNGNELTLLITNGNIVQIDLSPILQPLIDENAAQQAQIDDLIARVEALEDCMCTLRVPENIADPNRPMLFQNIPNPFDNTTTISYYIPINYSSANLVISNTRGQLLNNLPLDVEGEGSIDFGSGTLPSGVYFYSLFVEGKKIDTKRMIVE